MVFELFPFPFLLEFDRDVLLIMDPHQQDYGSLGSRTETIGVFLRNESDVVSKQGAKWIISKLGLLVKNNISSLTNDEALKPSGEVAPYDASGEYYIGRIQ